MNLRLVKVTCPQCGAGMRLSPSERMVTCSYCGLSSLVQQENQPAPTPPNDGHRYGTIKLDPKKTRNVVLAIFFLVFGLPFLIIAMVFAFIFGTFGAIFSDLGSGTPRPPIRSPLPAPTIVGTTPSESDEGEGPLCAQTVACCKIVMRSTSAGADAIRACEAMRVLGEAKCKDQLESLRQSAKSLGKSCP